MLHAFQFLLVASLIRNNGAISLELAPYSAISTAEPTSNETLDERVSSKSSLATAVVNTQVLTIFNYQGSQIYIYSALSNENDNAGKPQKWLFYFVPIMSPVSVDHANGTWIYTVNDEVRINLMLSNDDVEELARQAIVKKYDPTIAQYSKYWDVAPLMIDSLTAYVVRGSGLPVEGVHPYKAIHPNQLLMEFRFFCSSTENTQRIADSIKNSIFEIEVGFYFAGFKQVTTNMISITGDQLKSVLSKTVADGGNKNPQYIHRNQGSSFVSSYTSNVKKMIYLESANANVSSLTTGLEDQFVSLFQQGIAASDQVKLDSKFYDQIWSSADLHPDRITSELQKLFKYNQTETQRHNFSDNYFDFDQAYAQSSTAGGGGSVSVLGLFSVGGNGGSTSSSSGHLSTTTQSVMSQTEIQNYLMQESIETAWTGEKFVPKSFNVHKLTDISDRLQVAIIAKQLIAEKSNGAIVRTINTRNSPLPSGSQHLRPIVGEIKLYSGNASSLPRHWLLCHGQRISRNEYQNLFSVIGGRFGIGDGLTTFQVPDFRNRFPLGVDLSTTLQQVSGRTGGSATQTLTVDQIPVHQHNSGSLSAMASGSHTHTITDPGHNHGGYTDSRPGGSGTHNLKGNGKGPFDDWATHSHYIPVGRTGISLDWAGSHSHSISGSTGSVGSGRSFSIMPPYQTIDYIIYTGNY